MWYNKRNILELNQRGRRRGNTATISKVALHVVVRSFLGREYKLGGDGENFGEPFDCWGMIREYVKLRYRVDINKFKDNYVSEPYEQVYDELQNSAIYLIKELIDDNFIKVVYNYKMPGDIVFAVSGEDVMSVGIYGGNNVFVITTEATGCITIGMNFYKIKDVYRWPLLSR